MKISKGQKIAFGSFIGLLLAFLLVVGLFFNKPLAKENSFSLFITKDMTVSQMLDSLRVKSDYSGFLAFKSLVKTFGLSDAELMSGHYRIDRKEPFYRVFMQIKSGRQSPVNFIFNNLRTKEQFAARVADQLLIDSLSVITHLNDSAFVATLGFTPQTVPAMLIPNTYQLYWNTNTQMLLTKLNAEYKRFWNDSRREKASNIGLTPVEVATLASIVEEESVKRSEQPRIAGLYLNRLRLGMPLQADPTIKFAMGNFELRRILKGHLAFVSPYNTYLNAGLPPGPIRIPSIHAIDAVLNREKHNYIYMCAKEDFSGVHNFAASFEEHQRNAARYRRALNERGIN
ncbi:MAG: endolytic transglycosylase MltG [Bacteroidales bacterium]